jgi:hypothetical protein
VALETRMAMSNEYIRKDFKERHPLMETFLTYFPYFEKIKEGL